MMVQAYENTYLNKAKTKLYSTKIYSAIQHDI